MKTTHFQRALLLGALCALTGTSFAQMGNGGGQRPNFNNRNNSQGNNSRSQARERQIRTALTNAGYTDTTVQEPVVTLAKMEQAASDTLTPKINAIRNAFQNGANGNNNNTNNSDTLANLLADYRSAITKIQNDRANAIDDLDKNISFSTDPKLEALLTMLGVIGDETGFVSNLSGQAQLPGSSNSSGGGPGGMNGGQGGMSNGGMNGGMGGFGGGMGGNMNGGGMAPPPPPDMGN